MKRLFISLLACGTLLGGTAALAHNSLDYGSWRHEAPWIKHDQTAAMASNATGPNMNCSSRRGSCIPFTQNYNLPVKAPEKPAATS